MPDTPSWITDSLCKFNRKTAGVWFSEYALNRKNLRNIDIELIIGTVQSGSVFPEKSTEPDRICLKKYQKTCITYFVVVDIFPTHLEVVTLWKKPGRW